MAVKTILPFDNPVLRCRTKRVSKIDKMVLRLIEDLTHTLEQSDGAGLAAPQIGSSLRVAVVCLPDQKPYAIINPEVIKRIGTREIEEGCLSLPGYQGRIKRSCSVTVKCLGIDGKPMKIRARDLLAQVLEHEIDHLDGVLYIDRLENRNKVYKVDPGEEKKSEKPLSNGVTIGSVPAASASNNTINGGVKIG